MENFFGFFSMLICELGQAWKGAAAADDACEEV